MSLPVVDIRGVRVPLYPRMINYGVDSFARVAEKIDALPLVDREWAKIEVLISETAYLDFLGHAAGIPKDRMVSYLRDFLSDTRFRDEFSKKLLELEEAALPYAGDLRFHSLSLYALIRALQPVRFVETGVAQGKSSALILLAMHHNGRGRLVSVDLPNPSGSVLPDGSRTSTGSRPVGWLVPDYLRESWDLRLGDSLAVLPQIVAEGPLDGFLHDSLHTEDHAAREFALAEPAMRPGGMWLCDNIETGAGRAFEALLERKNLVAAAYRDFAAVRMTGESFSYAMG